MAMTAEKSGMKDANLKKIHNVVKELEALRDDELFQMDLKDESCIKAIEYWTTKPEERTGKEELMLKKFQDDYKIQNVFNRLKRLQYACKQVPMGVPLKAVLAGKTDPLYGLRDEQSSKNADSRNLKEGKDENPKAEEKIHKTEQSTDWLEQALTLTFRKVFVSWSVQIAIISFIKNYI